MGEDLVKESRNLSSDDSDFDPKQSNESQTLCESSVIPPATTTTSTRPSQNVVKIPLKRKVSSTGTGNTETTGSSAEKPKKKTKLDEEKENKNLAKLSWPEQLVRSKAAKLAAAASSRATTTSRHSVDSLDSMEMELAASEDKIPSLDTKSVATTTPISSLDN